jgi:hypothetical protein
VQGEIRHGDLPAYGIRRAAEEALRDEPVDHDYPFGAGSICGSETATRRQSRADGFEVIGTGYLRDRLHGHAGRAAGGDVIASSSRIERQPGHERHRLDARHGGQTRAQVFEELAAALVRLPFLAEGHHHPGHTDTGGRDAGIDRRETLIPGE